MYKLRNVMISIWLVVCTLLSSILLLVYKVTKNKKLAQWYVTFFARCTNVVAGNKVVVLNRYNLEDTKETFLIVANHESYFDIFSLSGISKKFICVFVAKKEFKKIPIISSWLTAIDAVFLDRENPRQAIKQMKQAEANLKNGNSMGIFPEGTRSKTDDEFKPGSIKFAVKAKATIIPLTIRNAAANFEERKNFGSNKTYMYLHKPITYEEYKDIEVAELIKLIQEKVQSIKLEDLKAGKYDEEMKK